MILSRIQVTVKSDGWPVGVQVRLELEKTRTPAKLTRCRLRDVKQPTRAKCVRHVPDPLSFTSLTCPPSFIFSRLSFVRTWRPRVPNQEFSNHLLRSFRTWLTKLSNSRRICLQHPTQFSIIFPLSFVSLRRKKHRKRKRA